MISKAKKSALNFDFENMMYVLSFKKPENNVSLHQKLLDSVKIYDGYSVALSGGYDSQFVCLILKEAGVKFNAISYRLFWKDEVVNANDVLACDNFCKKHNINIEFIDIDGYEFFNEDIFSITGKKYQSMSPQISLHCYFLEQTNSEKIICGGDIPYPLYTLDNKKLEIQSLIHLINKESEIDANFLRKFHLPYDLVGSHCNKKIVKNILYGSDEIYYLAMDINHKIIMENKILPPASPIVQNYRYKELYYNYILKENKLSFRFSQANGFENLQSHLAVISGNYNEFNDRYRQLILNNYTAKVSARLKCSKTDLEYIKNKFKILGTENDFEFIYDFKTNL